MEHDCIMAEDVKKYSFGNITVRINLIFISGHLTLLTKLEGLIQRSPER